MSPSFPGLTRADWEATADLLLTSVRPYATPNHSLIHLPGPQSKSGRHSDGLEGFARTFLLAAFRMTEDDPLDLASWYAEGLNPADWPSLQDCPQARVEAASIALALHETRPWIWDRLPSLAQERLVEWLSAANKVTYYANNWIWFQNITGAFLESVGAPLDPEHLQRNLALHERWYVGDGWYTDGGTRNFDYYAWWAMHFYPLWWCRMTGEVTLREVYRSRLRRFLEDAVHLVGADGAPVLQGRSATYRFGMLAPFWAGVLFDATPLSHGLTRRLTGGVLQYFQRHGAIDRDGLLPIGWHGSFTQIRQAYSGGASPYWGNKGFAGLLLPPDHPVWTAEEKPLPVELGDTHRVIAPPGWTVSGTRADGIIRVASHGTNHQRCANVPDDRPFYDRIGYSSHAAPDLGSPTWDSCAVLLDAGGNPVPRLPITPIATNTSASPGLKIASIVRGAIEVRVAIADQPLQLHFGGWAHSGDLINEIVNLRGLPKAGVTHGCNPLGTPSSSPWLRSDGPAVPGEIYAAAVILTGDPDVVAQARRITLSGNEITWPDGHRDTVDFTV